MSRLDRLKTAALMKDVVAKLKSVKIETVESFLFGPKKYLAYGVLSVHEIEALRAELEEEHAAPLTCALDLLAGARTEWSTNWLLSTGSACLDAYLGGGLFGGDITELVGQFSTGKSQFCHDAAVKAVTGRSAMTSRGSTMDAGFHRAWYIDTSNNFSPRRIREIVIEQGRKIGRKENVVPDILDHIICFKVKNVYMLANLLEQAKYVLDRTADNCPLESVESPARHAQNLRLVIVDSLTSLFLPFMSSFKLIELTRVFMVHVSQLMKSLAAKHRVLFLLTNMAVSEFRASATGQSNLKAALGKYWSSVPHVRLFFRYPATMEEFEGGKRKLQLTKSTHTTVKQRAVSFYISRSGVDGFALDGE